MRTPDGYSTPATTADFQVSQPELAEASQRIAGLSEDYKTAYSPIAGAVEGAMRVNLGLPGLTQGVTQFFTSALASAVDEIAKDLDNQHVQLRYAMKVFEEEEQHNQRRAATLASDGLRQLPGTGVA